MKVKYAAGRSEKGFKSSFAKALPTMTIAATVMLLTASSIYTASAQSDNEIKEALGDSREVNPQASIRRLNTRIAQIESAARYVLTGLNISLDVRGLDLETIELMGFSHNDDEVSKAIQQIRMDIPNIEIINNVITTKTALNDLNNKLMRSGLGSKVNLHQSKRMIIARGELDAKQASKWNQIYDEVKSKYSLELKFISNVSIIDTGVVDPSKKSTDKDRALPSMLAETTTSKDSRKQRKQQTPSTRISDRSETQQVVRLESLDTIKLDKSKSYRVATISNGIQLREGDFHQPNWLVSKITNSSIILKSINSDKSNLTVICSKGLDCIL
jgi:hypothetical protein